MDLLQWVNKRLPRLKCGNLVERIWCFDCPAAAKLLKTATDAVVWDPAACQRRSGAGFRTLQKSDKNEVSGELSAVSPDTTSAVAWRPTATLSVARSETNWEHLRIVPRHC